jgi:CRISPR-associated protein Csx14
MIGSTISELFPVGWPVNVSHAQEIFPSPLSLHVDDKGKPSTTKLPGLLRLTQNELAMDSWSDGSSRPDFKLYSGNRSGCSICSDMLFGKRDKPKKGKTVGDLANEGIRQLFENDKDAVIRDPLNRLVSMAGSFNLDPRGAWNAMDAGYSPNEHGHAVFASPIVEFMGCFALQNMRPLRLAKGEYCYATWDQSLPGSLARVVCSGTETPYYSRHFQFDLALAGKNKLVTFAEETTQPTP